MSAPRGRAADRRTPAFTGRARRHGRGPGDRLMFCFRTTGCVYAREAGPCTGCAFPYGSTWGEAVAATDMVAQFDSVFAGLDPAAGGLAEVDVYNAGSFFQDAEVPPAVRAHVYDWARAAPGLETFLVESRAQDLTPARLDEFRAGVPGLDLLVGVGIESADPRVRNDLLHKGLPPAELERALDRLAERGIGLLAYMLFKAPGMSERDAIEDATRTGEYLRDASHRRGLTVVAALQPAFVQRGTAFQQLQREDRFRPPWIWSVYEAARALLGLGLTVAVGTSEDDPPPIDARRNCGRCDAAVEAALADLLRTEDRTGPGLPDCGCRAQWAREMDRRPPDRLP